MAISLHWRMYICHSKFVGIRNLDRIFRLEDGAFRGGFCGGLCRHRSMEAAPCGSANHSFEYTALVSGFISFAAAIDALLLDPRRAIRLLLVPDPGACESLLQSEPVSSPL